MLVSAAKPLCLPSVKQQNGIYTLSVLVLMIAASGWHTARPPLQFLFKPNLPEAV
jgi:hypothetical protein